MIYLNGNNAGEQTIFVPHGGYAGETGYFRVWSTVDVDEWRAIPVSSSRRQGAFLVLTVTLPEDVHKGEYEYELLVGDGTVSGLLRVTGEDEVEVVQYGETYQVKQYGESE